MDRLPNEPDLQGTDSSQGAARSDGLDGAGVTPVAATPTVPGPTLIALLIAASAVSPLGINMYLPSMPAMARALSVDFATIQLTLSLYLAAMAVGQLVLGPLSDRLGRRPVLLVGLAIFAGGSFVCTIAQSIELLIAGRVVQALGGCTGITLSRAIIRDLYDRDRVASMIGYVTMGMAVAPMIAPTVGGVLEAGYGWRASFAFLTAFGTLVLLFAVWRLPETNRGRNPVETVRAQARGYAGLVRSRRFWGYALTTAFVSAVFFALLAGAPYVTIEVMGRSPAEYGLYFAFVPSGYLLGNLLTGRFAVRWGPDRMIVAGVLMVALSTALAALAFALGLDHPLALFAPMFLMGAGNGLVLPSGIAGAVSVRPELAGAAAGLSGSLQIGFGAMIAPVVGAVLAASVWPLIVIMAACSALALASFGLVAASRVTTPN